MPRPPRQIQNAFTKIALYGFQSVTTCSMRAPTKPSTTAHTTTGNTPSGSSPRRASWRRVIHTAATTATASSTPYQRGCRLPIWKANGSPGLGKESSTAPGHYPSARSRPAHAIHSTLDR